MATEAQRKASEKYIAEKCEELKVRVPKGMKAEIKARAEAEGKSVNAYILERLLKENNKSTMMGMTRRCKTVLRRD